MRDEDIIEAASRLRGLNPLKYKPKQYSVLLTCGTDLGQTASATQTLDAIPFVLDKISHQIIGNSLDISTPPEQDGQYRLLYRDDQTTYMDEPLNAVAAFGDAKDGRIEPLPCRVFLDGSRTLTVDMINDLDRRGQGAEFFRVQVVFHGIELWNRR